MTDFVLEPRLVPDLVAGGGLLALVALLLWVAPRDRVHRAFALFLVVEAMGNLTWVARHAYAAGGRPDLSSYFVHVSEYYHLALPFAAVFFAIRFADLQGGRTARHAPVVLALGAAVALGVFAWDHELDFTITEGALEVGPLFLIASSNQIVVAAVAFLFARRAAREAPGRRRSGLLLASLAFILAPAFWGVVRPAGLVMTLAESQVQGAGWIVAATYAMYWLTPAVVLATVVATVLSRPLRSDAASRTIVRSSVLGSAIAAAIGAVYVALSIADRAPIGAGTLDGLLSLPIPIIVSYTLLRHELLGIDVKLRFAISRSTIAAVFIAVFFVASEAAQQFFGEAFQSSYIGILAAGALVFAIAPLSRLADRIAEKAVPVASGAGPVSPTSADAESDYADALAAVMRDGRISQDEEVALARLAERAGIGVGAATRIRHEVEARANPRRRSGAESPK